MVLISKAEYDLLIRQREQKVVESAPELVSLKVAEKKCEEILHTENQPEDLKNAIFQDAMKKVLLNRKQNEKRLLQSKEAPSNKKFMMGLSSSWENKICNSVPQRFKTRARSLWSALANSPSQVCVSDNGEVEIGGFTIPSSNIIDLISHAVKDSKGRGEPVGWSKFLGLLQQPGLNVPLSALGKTVRLSATSMAAEAPSHHVQSDVKGMGDRFVWLRVKKKTKT